MNKSNGVALSGTVAFLKASLHMESGRRDVIRMVIDTPEKMKRLIHFLMRDEYLEHRSGSFNM